MNDFPGAVGEAVQGGLTARAVEPSTGQSTAAAGHTHESACLNCGTRLVGTHCHACGQRGHVHRTLSAFFHDLLHGVLHFEGKIWRTLPLLMWRPDKLTREYIDGRRASYISPIALFLFVIFLFFAIFSALGSTENWADEIQVSSEIATEQAYRAADREIDTLQRRLDSEEDSDDRAELGIEISELEKRQASLAQVLHGTEPDAGITTKLGATAEGRLKSAWQKAKENPQLLIYKLQTNAYKFAWLLIPLSVPFVALTFLWRRKFGLYDHTIFATYSITFMFALVGVATLVTYFFGGRYGLLVLMYAPYHMYRQLRGTYGLSRFSSLWRLIALSVFAWVTIGIFAGLLVTLAEG